MKIYDEVKVIVDKEEYTNQKVFKGMIGTIIQPEIRDKDFLVCFNDPRLQDKSFVFNDETIKTIQDDIIIPIKIEDLELVKEGFGNDKIIFEELPSPDKRWWCKVEGGYIVNLNGDKKNKIPYDYNS
ncbi:MAG: hypothetical protein J6Q13_02980 [Clostridia bacterium]|nr:hypothetical protein [Clostridia bacterium]